SRGAGRRPRSAVHGPDHGVSGVRAVHLRRIEGAPRDGERRVLLTIEAERASVERLEHELLVGLEHDGALKLEATRGLRPLRDGAAAHPEPRDRLAPEGRAERVDLERGHEALLVLEDESPRPTPR